MLDASIVKYYSTERAYAVWPTDACRYSEAWA